MYRELILCKPEKNITMLINFNNDFNKFNNNSEIMNTKSNVSGFLS